MDNKGVKELKKRFTKDKASFTRVCTCYVDSNKNKVAVSSQRFLNLDEDVFYKYLEIAKKSLGGRFGNNLINIDFPISSEEDGVQNLLMKMKNTELNNEDILNTFYDHVIDTYDYAGNYLITLFMDNYDVIKKTEDNISIDESEETYSYIICAICPVELTKPALGFNEKTREISASDRLWNVKAPETAFLFPAFNDRSSDIHSALFYTKNTKEPHTEFISAGLECEPTKTADEKKMMFNHIIAATMGVENNSDALIDLNIELNNQFLEENETDREAAVIEEENIKTALENTNISKENSDAILNSYKETFKDETVKPSDIIDAKIIKENALVRELFLQINELQERNRILEKENMELKG